jgi:hypothetical protein
MLNEPEFQYGTKSCAVGPFQWFRFATGKAPKNKICLSSVISPEVKDHLQAFPTSLHAISISFMMEKIKLK